MTQIALAYMEVPKWKTWASTMHDLINTPFPTGDSTHVEFDRCCWSNATRLRACGDLWEELVLHVRLTASLTVIDNVTDRPGTYDLHLVSHGIYGSDSYRLGGKRRFPTTNANSSLYLTPLLTLLPLELGWAQNYTDDPARRWTMQPSWHSVSSGRTDGEMLRHYRT